jgi:hypothetical protein
MPNCNILNLDINCRRLLTYQQIVYAILFVSQQLQNISTVQIFEVMHDCQIQHAQLSAHKYYIIFFKDS